MKKILLVVAVAMSVTAILVGASPEPWMDMENCEICKPLSTDKELMMNMTWEHYPTKSGMISVTTVNEGYAERFEVVQAKMKAAIGKTMAGEKVEMCNMCMGMGSFFQKGATAEKIKTSNGEISITSSDNAEVVKEIHAWVERTGAEMKKMHKSMQGETGGEGHGH